MEVKERGEGGFLSFFVIDNIYDIKRFFIYLIQVRTLPIPLFSILLN